MKLEYEFVRTVVLVVFELVALEKKSKKSHFGAHMLKAKE